MASHVYVVDAGARRTQIKTMPNTYLRNILDEACQKMKLDPDQYTLKTSSNKQLDLSLTIRLSGLSSGAKLQLTQASRSPSVVSVALQLPPSENSTRLQDRFPSNTSLWLVLRKFEEGVAGGKEKLNLTQRAAPPNTTAGAGRLGYEQPCLNIMGREFASFTDLQKTLAQLGFNSGSVLLRLTFRVEDTPMEEAMTQISNYFKAVQPSSESQAETASAHGAHANPDVKLQPLPNADADNSADSNGATHTEPSEDAVMTPPPPSEAQLSEQPAQDDTVLASSSETPLPSTESQFPSLQTSAEPAPETTEPDISVYSAPTGSAPAAALQAYNPADFEPSVEHAHSHQATLNRAAQNRRLQSDKELETAQASRQAALASVQSLTLRVRFPDQMMVDMTLTQNDTVATLHDKIRDMLADASQPFQLRYTNAKGAPATLEPGSQQRLIANLGLTGRVLVTMIWAEGAAHSSPVLKQELLGQAKQLQVRTPDEDKMQDVKSGAASASKPDDGKRKASGNKGDVEAKMKKLLGFGKKK